MNKVKQLVWLLALGIIFFLFLRYDKNPAATGKGICADHKISNYALGYMHGRGKYTYQVKSISWDNENETYKVEFDNQDIINLYFDKDGSIKAKR